MSVSLGVIGSGAVDAVTIGSRSPDKRGDWSHAFKVLR